MGSYVLWGAGWGWTLKVSEGFADQSTENRPSKYIKSLMEFFKNG